MRYLRPLTLGALSLAVTSVLAMELGGYSVAKLHRGFNNLSAAVAGHRVSVVIGHRENFNAHSFDVVTFYLSEGERSDGLDILGLWDKDSEALTLKVSGGADCLLHDFRLLVSNRGDPPMLVVADRPWSYGDNAPVSFKFYVLKLNADGWPSRFQLLETRTSKAEYCDVEVALSRELGLGDYRATP